MKRLLYCPYCGSIAILKSDAYIYGPQKCRGEKVYVCSHYPICDSYVSVHKGTTTPRGTLANKKLRKKRVEAHLVFDQLWKRGIFTRSEAYQWMADSFSLTSEQAHIGLFGEYMCDQLIQMANSVLKSNNKILQSVA